MFESLNKTKSRWKSFYRWNPLILSKKVQLRSIWDKTLKQIYDDVGDNVILVTFSLLQIYDIGELGLRFQSVTNIPKL